MVSAVGQLSRGMAPIVTLGRSFTASRFGYSRSLSVDVQPLAEISVCGTPSDLFRDMAVSSCACAELLSSMLTAGGVGDVTSSRVEPRQPSATGACPSEDRPSGSDDLSGIESMHLLL